MKICIICKNNFKEKRKWQIYCSNKCVNIAHHKKHKKEDNKRSRLHRINNPNYHKQKDIKHSKEQKITGLNTYFGIKTRCYNTKHKDYKYYGAKGIKCLLTKDEFIILWQNNICAICCKMVSEDNRSKNPNAKTLDRINSDGHYEKNNIRIVCKSCNSGRGKNE